MENIEESRKKLINKRSELKEQFLREEISAEEYNRLKGELEEEFEKLQDLEENSKENKELIKEELNAKGEINKKEYESMKKELS
ncbi:MAG: hypothetical protein V1663_02990 [archaeon]